MNHLEYLGEPQWDRITEGLKSKVRSKAGHMFGIMKGIFRFRKARYRGLKKNSAKPRMIFAGACSAEIRADGMPLNGKRPCDDGRGVP
jgi:hypothetical protein